MTGGNDWGSEVRCEGGRQAGEEVGTFEEGKRDGDPWFLRRPKQFLVEKVVGSGRRA